MSGIFLSTDIPISRPAPSLLHAMPSLPMVHLLQLRSPFYGSRSFPGVPSPSGFRPPCLPLLTPFGFPPARSTTILLAIPFASCKNARVFTKWNSHFFDVSSSPKFGLPRNLSARRRNTI